MVDEQPTIICGDFNCILRKEDKKGGKPFRYLAASREFDEFIINNGLVETDFEGPAYTWCNNQGGSRRVWVRHDRFFLNEAAISLLPGYRLQHLLRVNSDHCPLLFTADKLDFRNRHAWVKFEDTWLEFPTATRIVQHAWAGHVEGSASTILSRKCFRTLGALKKWSGNMVDNLCSRRQVLETCIADLQARDADAEGLCSEELESLVEMVREFSRVQGHIVSWWRQWAKVRWLTDGDRNTSYFHTVATARRRANRILHVTDDHGRQWEDQANIMGTFTAFFQRKWVAGSTNMNNFPIFEEAQQVSASDNLLLTRPVSILEIRHAVFSLGRGRSPGIDGITGTFFQGYWDTVQSELVRAVLHFFEEGSMPCSWKRTLVVLIPKRDKPRTAADFRPISLCTTIYKIVAKILVNRLKPILPKIISLEQGAFVPSRSIADNVLLAQELMNRLRTNSSKVGLMALKVDMEQAYDKMSWDCLERTMLQLGFSAQWRAWIMACITHPSFAVMINGDRSNWINATCGFRQGCPLSPYLFILCSELLSASFHAHALDRVPLGIRCSPGGPLISHLLYADDILVVASTEMDSCRTIRNIFDCYCGWTGQTLNKAKCSITFSKGVPGWKSRRIAQSFGFDRKKEILYLGVCLKLTALTAKDFDGLLQQVNDRLRGWGTRSLSLAGRLLLINSVLLMIPVFLLSHCVIPKYVLLKVERAARDFLWHGRDGHGLHYKAWDLVCMPKSAGGLGIHGLERWQGALLARHAYRFLAGDDSLLKSCLTARYGASFSHYSPRRSDSMAWKLLCLGFSSLRNSITWTIGNGVRTSFDCDNWIFGRSLSTWPTFINSLEDLPTTVGECISDDGSWNLEFLLRFCGDDLAHAILNMPRLDVHMADAPALLCNFSGKSVSALVYERLFVDQCWEFLWVWKLKLRPREAIFWWRICWDAIPTASWLFRRGLSQDTCCPWGCGEAESLEHVIVKCKFTRDALLALKAWGFLLPSLASMQQVFTWLRKESSCGVPSPAATVFCYLIYQVWRNRLAKSHDRPHATPGIVAATVLGNIFCGPSPAVRFWGTSATFGKCNPPFWCPPPRGWLKANVDGSLLPNGSGGFAFVVRDEMGDLMLARGGLAWHWDSGEMEKEAVLLLRDHVMPLLLDRAGLILEGDCANLLKHIQEALVWLRNGSSDRRIQCFSFLLEIPCLLVKHVDRQCNRLADCAAYLARQDEFCWTDASMAPSSFCALLLYEKAFVTA